MTRKKILPTPTPMELEVITSNNAEASIHSLNDFSKLWQLAFDASQDMISVLDMQHRIVAVNKAMANAMGCEPGLAKGRHCYELMHETGKPPETCPHLALMEDGKPHETVIYEALLDQWLQINVTPLYNSNNQLAGSIHIARDITLQKRSEQAQRESEERYHHLSDATMEGVLLSDDSTIVAANQVLAEMMGYNDSEMIGMNMLKFVAPADRSRLIQSLRDRRAGTHTFECVRKDGTLFTIEAHTRAITYKEGIVYQTAIRDLTEQIRADKERIQHARMRGVLEMAGAVCHEINQPLMALQGFMEIMMARSDPDQNPSRHLQRMDEQVNRIKELTHKIMHITRYETKDYAGGEKIIDIEQSAPENENL